MAVVRLIHWNASEGRERAPSLADTGHQVVFDFGDAPAMIRGIRENPPDGRNQMQIGR